MLTDVEFSVDVEGLVAWVDCEPVNRAPTRVSIVTATKSAPIRGMSKGSQVCVEVRNSENLAPSAILQSPQVTGGVGVLEGTRGWLHTARLLLDKDCRII